VIRVLWFVIREKILLFRFLRQIEFGNLCLGQRLWMIFVQARADVPVIDAMLGVLPALGAPGSSRERRFRKMFRHTFQHILELRFNRNQTTARTPRAFISSDKIFACDVHAGTIDGLAPGNGITTTQHPNRPHFPPGKPSAFGA
jgi:hypothetical protein